MLFAILQGPNNTTEVHRISSDGPASISGLKVGYQILCINDHRVPSVDKCSQLLKHYIAKQSSIQILASAGPVPPGCQYVLVKANKERPLRTVLKDGSFQGLFLEEEGGAVRVKDVGKTGIFARAKINKRDVVLTINGYATQTMEDCEMALRKCTNDIVPVLTSNVFRKARSTLFVSSTSNSVERLDLVHSPRSVTERYELGKELGSGAFGTVVLCKAKGTGNKFAMKVVNRSILNKTLEEALKQEISILNDLDHPNIVKLIETFSTIETHYLVTELVEGGELFDRIVEKTCYTESEARDVSRTLFEALKYCHSKHVCHRDLKVS
jgi:membrane-associated protease RseP (regulator of RpoE activity)